MTSPYREAPGFLPCPRCGELLDLVFSGVAACPRCQGAWIPLPALDSAFGSPRWPTGQGMWWHDELECPECAAAGTVAKLSARSSNEVMVDACPAHGVWLDHGELGRLMSLSTGDDELLALQHKIAGVVPNPEILEQRRRAWRLEREARERKAAKLRAEFEALQARRAAELAAAEKKHERDEADARMASREKAMAADAGTRAKIAAREAEKRRLEDEHWAKERVDRQHRLDQRAKLDVKIVALRTQLTKKQGVVTNMTSALERLEKELRELDAIINFDPYK